MLLKDLLLFFLGDFRTNSVLLPGFALCINSIGGRLKPFTSNICFQVVRYPLLKFLIVHLSEQLSFHSSGLR